MAIALFVPQTNSFEDPYEGARWMWPRVTSGDEPHYLVLINSLVRDGDLDVAPGPNVQTIRPPFVGLIVQSQRTVCRKIAFVVGAGDRGGKADAERLGV